MLQAIKLTRFGVLGLILTLSPVWAADVSSSMLTIEKFSAERGDAQSQYFMGEHHEFGDSGVAKNTQQALQWYRKAAAQGHPAAQYKIGEFYERGLGGLSQDPAQAKTWYEKAAENGSIAARKRLDNQAEADKLAELQKKRQEDKKRQSALEQERKLRQEVTASLAAKAASDRALQLAAERKRQQETEARNPVYPLPELITGIIGSKWYEGNRGAEFLPTIDMSCVKSKEEEATCFSGERLRIIAGAELLFSVKATLHQFKDDGKFDVAYEYNVLEKRSSTQQGSESDEYGLISKEGWQQRLMASCQLKDMNSMECSLGQGQKRKFQTQ